MPCPRFGCLFVFFRLHVCFRIWQFSEFSATGESTVREDSRRGIRRAANIIVSRVRAYRCPICCSSGQDLVRQLENG